MKTVIGNQTEKQTNLKAMKPSPNKFFTLVDWTNYALQELSEHINGLKIETSAAFRFCIHETDSAEFMNAERNLARPNGSDSPHICKKCVEVVKNPDHRHQVEVELFNSAEKNDSCISNNETQHNLMEIITPMLITEDPSIFQEQTIAPLPITENLSIFQEQTIAPLAITTENVQIPPMIAFEIVKQATKRGEDHLVSSDWHNLTVKSKTKKGKTTWVCAKKTNGCKDIVIQQDVNFTIKNEHTCQVIATGLAKICAVLPGCYGATFHFNTRYC
ncbi:hypothetical protein HELRODRAFT_178720 [Helobdella robusta]|uniref:FLYWCH-type domain-containing protein n=1 Tax=Helobdella robusta TaxID=6412 RepID=T1FDM6_HELRO|nr:hypothetical protein HELRODRAFT_178720 [Helobdella robusta]ESN96920.1 hypothetical protein HELRODRAFT_178720 [Helobdella robusta]